MKATALEKSDKALLKFDRLNYAIISYTPELLVPLSGSLDNAHLILAPSLSCEWRDTDRFCDRAIKMGLHGNAQNGNGSFEIMLHLEKSSKTSGRPG